ncbi:MAG TPA: hypothetical protein VFF08_08940 [Trueperaceae bacterium]|nr:hypothetical protein [Trueperaceae bacterium]
MSFLAALYLVVALLLLGTLAAQSVAARHRQVISVTFGSALRLLVGLGLFAVVLYATAYFLGLVGGFYESLTCKVVTLPSCEDPLALPAWLALPEASVGGVIGILPLLGIFLAKALQPKRGRAGPNPDEPAYDAATYEANPPRNYFVFEREGGAFSVLATEDLPTALLPPEARQALAARADERPWRERALAGFLSWLQANAALVGIFVVELWLAWLRGAAEAADRQVRLALGLDADLPAAYLGVAQWGAVVLALGLSVVVVFLGVVAQHGLHVAGRGFAGLRQGAGIVDLVGSTLAVFASGLRQAWTVSAIAIGRFALKAQSALTRLWVLSITAIGRALLKLQSGAMRAWAFLAILVGTFVLFLSRVFGRVFAWLGGLGRRRRREGPMAAVGTAGPDDLPEGVASAPPEPVGARRSGGGVLVLAAVAGLGLLAPVARAATTFVVLQDVSGGESSRLQDANRRVLSWADPSPQRALLQRSDRLVVIPVRAPGALDTVYAALFNAEYPSSQLDRFAFYAELRAVLPTQVDAAWGTGLSEALRTAAFYLRDVPDGDEKVLVVFGNGEDHSPEAVTAEELRPALEGAVVVRLNAGLVERDRWTQLYQEAGARAQLVYDQAATRLLTIEELKRDLERARQR